MGNYYSLPLDLSTIMDEEAEPLRRCSEIQSIDSCLDMLLTTRPGEHKFDPNWGCKLWDLDFEIITSQNKWEVQCEEFLTQMIATYEQRLKDVKVRVKIAEVTRTDKVFRTPAVKKKVNIFVESVLKTTGEKYCFHYQLYMGPIASE